MLNLSSVRNDRDPVVLTGEVVYEAVPVGAPDQRILKRYIHRALDHALWPFPDSPAWANYLVIFSPGQEIQEVRCQVDFEAAGERAGFRIGYGPSPDVAFSDALERLKWFEHNQPIPQVV